MTSLKRGGCDRFGLQFNQRVDPDTVRSIENALTDKYSRKTSGDRIELYREINYLSDGSPDMDAIRSIHQELLSALESAKKNIENSTSPKSLKFNISLFNSWGHTIEFDGIEMRYEYRCQYGPTKTRLFLLENRDWDEFVSQIERLGVWNWEDSYDNLCLDGKSWSLEIEHGGRHLSCHGSNAYPGVKGTKYGKNFTSFLEAISQLIGDDGIASERSHYVPEQVQDAQSIVFNSFTPTYQYRIKNGQPVEEKILDEKQWEAAGVVYARADAKTKSIVYIGKTDGPLKDRVNDHLRRIPGYTKPKDTDYRDWAENKIITIYAHQPKRKSCLGLSIPIHSGLEHALIDAIDPKFVSRK